MVLFRQRARAYETRDWRPAEDGRLTEALYELYALQSVCIPGAPAPATALVQSAAMASVAPPRALDLQERHADRGRPARLVGAGAGTASGAALVALSAGHTDPAGRGHPVRHLRAVIAVESAGQASVVSSKGAIGLMQIMPGTWSDLRLRYHLGADPFDVHDNVLAGRSQTRRAFISSVLG